MRSSSLLAVFGAALVIASPLHQNLHKRKIVWDIVTEIEYVTITDDGSLPEIETVHVTSTHVVVPIQATSSSSEVIPTTTSTPPPPPPPSSSSTPPPPAPTTTAAPAPAPETSVQAAVFAATTAAPVVKPAVETPEAAPTPTPTPEPETSSTPATSAAAAPNSYAQAAVNQHNKHRTNHSAPALTWSSELAGYAQQVANKCVFAHDLSPGGGGYGQNIDSVGFSSPTSGWDPSAVIINSITNGWYNGEAKTFADEGFYGVSQPNESAGQILHFTQLVWDSTTTVGCASVNCPQNSLFNGMYGWFTVCNYGPAGNYAGEYAKEVKKPIGEAYIHPAEPWL